MNTAFYALVGLLHGLAGFDQQSSAPQLRLLVHTGDLKAKAILNDQLSVEDTRRLAENLGYDVFSSKEALVFLPKPAWSEDRTTSLRKLFRLAQSGQRIDSSRLDAPTRQHLRHVLSSSGVGGVLGDQMRNSDMKAVRFRHEIELTVESGGKRAKLPVSAALLAQAFAKPDEPVYSALGMPADAHRGEKPFDASESSKPDQAFERPELYGLLTRSFCVDFSTPVDADLFKGFLDFIKSKLEERRERQWAELQDEIHAAFEGVLGDDATGAALMAGQSLAYDRLPNSVKGILGRNADTLLSQLNLSSVGGDREQAFMNCRVSAPSGVRVMVEFLVASVSTKQGPVERWVGFRLQDLAE